MNPFYVEAELSQSHYDEYYTGDLCADSSFMYARQGSFNQMFENLHALNQKREHDSIDGTRESMMRSQEWREADLDVIHEEERDETGIQDRHDDSSEIALLAEESHGDNVPFASQNRRSTMMTDMSKFREEVHEFSSEEND